MCEIPGEKMDAATAAQMRSVNWIFDQLFGAGTAFGKAENNMQAISDALRASAKDDEGDESCPK